MSNDSLGLSFHMSLVSMTLSGKRSPMAWMTTPLGSASVMLPAAPRPRPPRPTRPTLMRSEPWAWAKLVPSAAKVAAAAVDLIRERRVREEEVGAWFCGWLFDIGDPFVVADEF